VGRPECFREKKARKKKLFRNQSDRGGGAHGEIIVGWHVSSSKKATRARNRKEKGRGATILGPARRNEKEVDDGLESVKMACLPRISICEENQADSQPEIESAQRKSEYAENEERRDRESKKNCPSQLRTAYYLMQGDNQSKTRLSKKRSEGRAKSGGWVFLTR